MAWILIPTKYGYNMLFSSRVCFTLPGLDISILCPPMVTKCYLWYCIVLALQEQSLHNMYINHKLFRLATTCHKPQSCETLCLGHTPHWQQQVDRGLLMRWSVQALHTLDRQFHCLEWAQWKHVILSLLRGNHRAGYSLILHTHDHADLLDLNGLLGQIHPLCTGNKEDYSMRG